MEFIEVRGKTVEEAITNAQIQLGTTSDKIEYEIIERESNGFLGIIGKKDAVIKARKKSNLVDDTLEFLDKMFAAMEMEVKSTIDYSEENRTMNIDFSGDEMGILIGKRGQTLDSLQYLTSLVVNKDEEKYTRVVVDAENYRERREDALVTLAKRTAQKATKYKKNMIIEPKNPYERRIIHLRNLAEKEAKKEAKKEPQAPAGVRNSGAVRRIAEKKGRPGQGKPGSDRAKGPAAGKQKTRREHKPRVTGKRGN